MSKKIKSAFYWNNMGRIIAIFRPGSIKSLHGEIWTKCSKPTWSVLNHICNMNDLEVSSTFKGVANCANDDEYDEEYGKGLAEQKAMLKYHKSMSKKYKKMIDILRKALDEATELEVRHYRKARNIEEDYRKYYLGE